MIHVGGIGHAAHHGVRAGGQVRPGVVQRRPAAEHREPGIGVVQQTAAGEEQIEDAVTDPPARLAVVDRGRRPATTAASWSRVSSRSVAYSVPGDMAASLDVPRLPAAEGSAPRGLQDTRASPPRRPPPRPPARRGAPRPVRRAASGWWRSSPPRRCAATSRPRPGRRAARLQECRRLRAIRGNLLSDRRPPSRHAPPDRKTRVSWPLSSQRTWYGESVRVAHRRDQAFPSPVTDVYAVEDQSVRYVRTSLLPSVAEVQYGVSGGAREGSLVPGARCQVSGARFQRPLA